MRAGCRLSVAAVILAAGASRRLGEPKQIAVIGGERLLDRAVRIAHEAGCWPLVVVLGAAMESVSSVCSLDGTTVVVNPDWEEGMGSSIRAGIAAVLPSGTGVIVMTCDQPAVTVEHMSRLAECEQTTASTYAGRNGVPAYFPQTALALLTALQGDVGARELLASARTIPLPGGELDVDTPESLTMARNLYG